MKKPIKRYSDEQTSAMLQNAPLWMPHLRDAARERGCALPSVAPIRDVLVWLREKLAADAATKETLALARNAKKR